MKLWLCIFVACLGAARADEQASVPAASLEAKLGTAAQNVELTVYVVSALAQDSAQASRPQPAREELPQDVTSALQQVRGVFNYKTYRLLDVVTLRGRNFSSSVVGGDLSNSSHYEFQYARARISPEAPRVVHLDGINLQIWRRHADRVDTIVKVVTDLDLREGQKTVLGKSAVDGSDALFLILVPKIVE
jgi:hypothetical protein